jgi:hypothetical protein
MTNFNNALSTITVDAQKEFSDFDLTVHSDADMDALVASFREHSEDQSRGIKNAKREFEVAEQSALHDKLALAYAICRVMWDQNNRQLTLGLLARNGMSPARRGANEFGPLIQLLFGRWVKVETKKGSGIFKDVFRKHRSAEKYAKVMRYLASQAIKPENAAAIIASTPGKMEGILEKDTLLHAKSDVDEQAIEGAVKAIKAKATLATLAKSAVGLDSKDKRTYVALWAEVENGQVHIKGLLPTGEDAITAAIRKDAKKIAPTLAQQNAAKAEDEEVADSPELEEQFPDAPGDSSADVIVAA